MRLARLALVALVAVGGVGALRDGGELSPPRAAADSSPQTPPALFLRSAGQSSKSDAAAAIIREIFEAQDDENCGYISCDEAIAAAKMLGALSSASFEAFDPRDSEVTSVRACAHCCLPLWHCACTWVAPLTEFLCTWHPQDGQISLSQFTAVMMKGASAFPTTKEAATALRQVLDTLRAHQAVMTGFSKHKSFMYARNTSRAVERKGFPVSCRARIWKGVDITRLLYLAGVASLSGALLASLAFVM